MKTNQKNVETVLDTKKINQSPAKIKVAKVKNSKTTKTVKASTKKEEEPKKEVTPAKAKTTPRVKARKNVELEKPYVGVIAKKGQKMINPREIVINWNDKTLAANPRIFFGNKKQWKVWKQSIEDNGFITPVRVYKSEDGRYHLRHGFRRMKAMLEILQEGKPENNFQFVPVEVVENNEKEALRDHFQLNSNLPLTDIEQAEGIRRYMKLTGQSMIAPVARELGIEYVKAVNLEKFIRMAHSEVVKAVNEGVITFSMAKNVVKNASTPAEQAKLIKEGRDTVAKAKTKTGKIRAYHIGKVKTAAESKNTTLDTKIFNILNDASTAKGIDTDFVSRMLNVLNAIKDGKQESEIEELMTPVAMTA
jgi:ParB-like chromosome segregation protein Spo0J